MTTQENRNFTMSPNALTDLYTRLPDFKAEHAKMYDVILRHYNADFGYAWPSTGDFMLALNCGETKVSEMKGVLVKYDLIDKHRHPTFGNDVYIPKKPIDNEADFYDEWPEAREYYEKRKAWIESRKESGKARKAAFDAMVRAQRKGDKVATVDDIPW